MSASPFNAEVASSASLTVLAVIALLRAVVPLLSLILRVEFLELLVVGVHHRALFALVTLAVVCEDTSRPRQLSRRHSAPPCADSQTLVRMGNTSLLNRILPKGSARAPALAVMQTATYFSLEQGVQNLRYNP